MGTRNLTVVQMGGEYVVAQYGQWDGFPSGQGVTVLEFCRARLGNIALCDDFMQRLAHVRFVDEVELKRMYASVGAHGAWMTMDQAKAFQEKWPTLDRDMAAEVLDHIWDAWPDGEVLLKNSINFAGDSLFCEWCYVVDLDKNKLEVFKGFNESPLPEGERFAELKIDRDPAASGTTYYQVKHLRSWPFDDLPSKETFVSECDPPEDEE